MDQAIAFKINNPDIALTGLHIRSAQQFLTATESTQVPPIFLHAIFSSVLIFIV
jgi:hypothetical protein